MLLLDTNILIDVLRGEAISLAWLEQQEQPHISVISWIEVLVGCRGGESDRMEAWNRCGSGSAMASRFQTRSSWPPLAAPTSASPPATAAISRPDLFQLHREPREVGISLKAAGRFDTPGLGRGTGQRIGQRFPGLHRPLRGNQQPAEPGAVALIGIHFMAQGGEATGAFVAGTCEFNY